MKNLLMRSLSGIIYVGLIIGAILCGEWTFYTLTSIFTVLAMYEMYTMSHQIEHDGQKYVGVQIVDTLGALLLSLSATMMYVGGIEVMLLSFVIVLTLYFLARAVVSLTDHEPHAYREVAKSIFSTLYIGLPMFLLNVLYIDSSTGKWLVLTMFVMIWLNDTGAYCFGSTLGKHRLCERLSPKKSWEGFWGGMLCCILCGVVCSIWINFLAAPMYVWILMGILVSVFSTWGDLFESMLKRTVQVKDSGNIIPGHGGIMDRIDSLLFVAPSMMLFFMIVLMLS